MELKRPEYKDDKDTGLLFRVYLGLRVWGLGFTDRKLIAIRWMDSKFRVPPIKVISIKFLNSNPGHRQVCNLATKSCFGFSHRWDHVMRYNRVV